MSELAFWISWLGSSFFGELALYIQIFFQQLVVKQLFLVSWFFKTTFLDQLVGKQLFWCVGNLYLALFLVAGWEVAFFVSWPFRTTFLSRWLGSSFFGELALFKYFASNLRQNQLFGVASWEVAFFGELALFNYLAVAG